MNVPSIKVFCQSPAVLAANGCEPVSISYATTPSAQTSEGGPERWPKSCCGAIYQGVPAMTPAAVIVLDIVEIPSALASPKSRTLTTSPVGVFARKMFSGLISRCRNCLRCASSPASRRLPLPDCICTAIEESLGHHPEFGSDFLFIGWDKIQIESIVKS